MAVVALLVADALTLALTATGSVSAATSAATSAVSTGATAAATSQLTNLAGAAGSATTATAAVKPATTPGSTPTGLRSASSDVTVNGPATYELAQSEDAQASSLGGTVVIDPTNSWAVLVGIDDYDSPTHPTYGGDGDVAAFQALLSQAGWSSSHIMVLTEQQATAQNITSAIRWLVGKSNPSSFSLFHYSGHVYENGGNEKYLWGVDNNFISDSQFGSDIQPLQGRAWIDIAGCESATFNQGISNNERYFTASSEANQKSYEEPSWHESVWSGLLADRGMTQHEAGSGPLSIQNAVIWAQNAAQQMTASQQPYGAQVPYAVGGTGEWYLGPSFAPPPPPPPVAAAPAGSGGTGSGGSGTSGSSGASGPCADLTLGFSNCP